MGKNRAVFIDRDGTLTVEVEYCSRSEDVRLLERSAEAICLINKSPLHAVLVTNQSGIARGYFDERRLSEIHKTLVGMLGKKGASLDGIYYCPHHKGGKIAEYTVECKCRKPNTGMLERASLELGISLAGSYIIGDKYSDIKTGKNAGICSIMVLTGYGMQEEARFMNSEIEPDYIAADLYDAVCWILKREKF